MGLALNEGKTKYMLSTSGDVERIDSQITADNYTFDIFKEFIYLGTAVTTKNERDLSKIFCPVRVGDDLRTRSNSELFKLR